MRRLIIRTALLTLFIAIFSTAAAAQPNGYIGGSVFADIREFGSTSAVPYYVDQFSLDATGAGGGLRIGTFLHPRWSLELSAEAASKTTVDVKDPVRILIYPPPPAPTFRASSSFLTVTTSVGFHPPAMGRVRLGYRAGFSFVRATYKSDYPYYVSPLSTSSILSLVTAGITLPTVLPSPIFTPRTITQEQNAGALALGFESAIDLTRRVAVVPEVRTLFFSAPNNGPGVFLIRPGVSVKWTF